MGGLGEEIHRLDLFNPIRPIRARQLLQIPGQGRGIAAQINQEGRRDRQNHLQDLRGQPLSGRVDNKHLVDGQEFLKMFRDVAIKKASVLKPIAVRILLGLDH